MRLAGGRPTLHSDPPRTPPGRTAAHEPRSRDPYRLAVPRCPGCRRLSPPPLRQADGSRGLRPRQPRHPGKCRRRTLAHARAVADNRRLWDAVQAAVLDPANGLPKELRAQIAGVAMAVLRECAAERPDLEFVAEMNDHFAAALWR
ncbi:flagellar biosynthesis regulator FlaF [Paeniroseomonas aquatica]|uniref:flagellar biosynthesis regulator FlaF n=1 Tax=Paeniroseomonas aquatica TaxID=373043 RepID=UPI00361BCE0F